MTRVQIMKSYLPDFQRGNPVFISLMGAEGMEFDQIKTSIEDVLKQFYVETATEEGLDRWEQKLGLASYAGKPLDQRRSRIISKLRGMGTITVQLIKEVAESYDGGTVEVTEQAPLYQFTIEFIDTLGIPPNIEDLMGAIEEIKPAHLGVMYKYRYNTHAVVGNYTHGYLAGYTHEQIRSTDLGEEG